MKLFQPTIARLLLAGTGLALAGCAAPYSDPYYAYEPGYYSPAPGYYYAPAPRYYAVPRQPHTTFMFSYSDRGRHGHRHGRRRHWH